MNKLFKHIIISTLFLLLGTVAFAQKNEYAKTKKQLKSFYSKMMTELENTHNSKGMIFQYSMMIMPKKAQPQSFRTSVFRKKDLVVVKNGKTEVYMDQDDVFMVASSIREVHWTSNLKVPDSVEFTSPLTKAGEFQRVLLDSSSITQQRRMKMNDQSYKYVVLAPNETIRTLFHLNKIEFWINEGTGQVWKVQNTYDQYHKYDRQEIKYELIDYDYKLNQYKSTARGNIVNSKNQLLTKYKSYKLITD